jgi:4-hydroxybenzoate polyprenyltransferase
MLDWLRLIRASGLFTIATNLAAAITVATYANGSLDPRLIAALLFQGNGLQVLWLSLASCLLFASGMLWNDLADLERDRELHPRRPLPSGRVGLAAAYVMGAAFAIGALLVAVASDAAQGFYVQGIPPYGFYTAGIVLSLALLYDFLTKHIPWIGSLTMAAVRAVHAVFALLLLGADHFRLGAMALLGIAGLDAAAGMPIGPAIYPLLLAVYIFGVTLTSELESRAGRRWELVLGGLLMMAAIVAGAVRLVTAHWIGALQATGNYLALVGGLFLGFAIIALWGWRVLVPWVAALRTGRKGMIGPLVGASLGGMILFDALLATTAHPVAGLAILVLYPFFRLAGRAIRMD